MPRGGNGESGRTLTRPSTPSASSFRCHPSECEASYHRHYLQLSMTLYESHHLCRPEYDDGERFDLRSPYAEKVCNQQPLNANVP